MSNLNLRNITNSLQDVRQVSLSSWRQANEFTPRDRGGPCVVMQEGYDPEDPKVLDFGLAKSRNHEGQVELTGATATLGTPLYMPPEAVEHPDRVDARTDLYSLGAVGYYLVTGETVFGGATIGKVLLQQVKAQPDKPSSRMREPLSADFEELLMRCLAKTPADRPASARELESPLGRCAAASQWGREQAEDWWRRRDAAKTGQTTVMKEPQPQST